MSLMRAFAKVAIAMALAKGSKSVLGRQNAPGNAHARDGVAETLAGKSGSTGLGDLLERISQISHNPGGLDDAISRAGSGGALGNILDNLTKGGGASTGIGGLLGSLATAAASAAGKGGFSDILNDALARQGEPKATPTKEQEATAALMLRAMIHASKADGRIDETERKTLMDNLEDATDEEKGFVTEELTGQPDPHDIARQTPSGLEPQIYAVSVMAINLDHPAEARYLAELAQALNLDADTRARIHTELGIGADAA